MIGKTQPEIGFLEVAEFIYPFLQKADNLITSAAKI